MTRLLIAAAGLTAGLLGSTAAFAQADGATVAFLMPDQASTRYEEHDHPGFVAEMKKLCPTCKVLYQNADGDASRLTILRAVASGALDRATDVAATLEVRGYATASKSRAAARPWSRHDAWFLASACGIIGLVIGAKAAGVAEFEAFPSLVVPLGAPEVALAVALVAVALLPFLDRRGIEP